MPENPHIGPNPLDDDDDKDVSLAIDPAAQGYVESADAVIAALQGDSLTIARVKEALPPLIAGLQFAAGAFPGGSAAINMALGLIGAISAKI